MSTTVYEKRSSRAGCVGGQRPGWRPLNIRERDGQAGSGRSCRELRALLGRQALRAVRCRREVRAVQAGQADQGNRCLRPCRLLRAGRLVREDRGDLAGQGVQRGLEERATACRARRSGPCCRDDRAGQEVRGVQLGRQVQPDRRDPAILGFRGLRRGREVRGDQQSQRQLRTGIAGARAEDVPSARHPCQEDPEHRGLHLERRPCRHCRRDRPDREDPAGKCSTELPLDGWHGAARPRRLLGRTREPCRPSPSTCREIAICSTPPRPGRWLAGSARSGTPWGR